MDLCVDACALLHAKQLDLAGAAGLQILERLADEYGLHLRTTRGVQAEQVAMSLSGTIERWTQARWWTATGVSAVQTRATQNRLQGLRPFPGQRDVGLLTLAANLGAVLLTHDDPAGTAARRLGLVVVDLLDLGDLLGRRDASLDLDALFDPWNHSAWRPADWTGSALATLAARPHRAALVARLDQAASG
jgi:hypothetical protein